MDEQIQIGTLVAINCSGEIGKVVATAEYDSGLKQALVRYKNSQGVAVEQWWDISALSVEDPD